MFRSCDTLAALLLWGLAGCAGERGHSQPLRVEFVTGGKGLGSYVVAMRRPDGRRERVSCPAGEGDAGVSCSDTGVEIEDPPARFELTVKVRGYDFVTRAVDLAAVEVPDGGRRMKLVLTPLATFERNEHYATGFAEVGGLAAFEEMALAVDTELGPSHVVKFYIDDAADGVQVYFQQTRRHPLHYPFVRDILGKALDPEQYEEQTYRGKERSASAGTLVYYPAVETDSAVLEATVEAPLVITFFPSDDLTPEQALRAHRLVEERLSFLALAGTRRRLLYLPAGEAQEQQLAQARDAFARSDAAWMRRRELFGGVSLQILNPGLAYGTLERLTPEELARKVVSYTDILLLTRLPNELPLVGGTITEELQTPLAHVNVAARSRGTPNIALKDAGRDARLAPLLGKLVRFEVEGGAFRVEPATLEEAQAFWRGRQQRAIVLEHDDERDGLPRFDELAFADSIRVGAKAANLAELHRLLDDEAPDGFAVPFHYYDRFLATSTVTAELCDAARLDCIDEGRKATLCDQARALCLPQRLEAYLGRVLQDEAFQRDAELREAVLDGLRYHMRHIPLAAAFARRLNERVAEVFGTTKIRLRSSTNAEDLAFFTGAGLYNSVSAYATGDKLASDQVRKVWASVWNWRAFEERSYWNIDHRHVRMGVAVNRAFVDEAANGVLITQNVSDPIVSGMYVNVQQGEVSVTNPEGGALPEIFSIVAAPAGGVQAVRLRYSSLAPEQSLLSPAETERLFQAANRVQWHFASLYQRDPTSMPFELEFKFDGPQRALFIKQARPYLQTSERDAPAE
jgi:pyruvate,water dikinase